MFEGKCVPSGTRPVKDDRNKTGRGLHDILSGSYSAGLNHSRDSDPSDLF